MFKNKMEEAVFTAVTSWIMIFIMGVYNVAINTGGLTYASFAHAARSFPLEWAIGFLCAYFIAGRVSKRFAFKVATPADRPLLYALWCLL